VALSLVYSYLTYARFPLTRPTRSDYDRATSHVREHWRPGDLIDANPFWATRVREYLGDLDVQGFRDLAREDLTPYRRVWLFSLFGAERREAVRQALEARGELVEEREFGRINLRLYAVRAPEAVRYDFRERLEEARVWVQRGEAREECSPRPRGRRQCSGGDWNYVGREIFEMADEPRAVVWAHPVSDGALTLEYDRVPLGRALTVGGGFLPAALDHGVPVQMTVSVDGRVLLRRVYDRKAAFLRERVETPGLSGGAHRVTFQIVTTDDRRGHFCFTAQVRE
jgi:hypothetical protein